MIRHSVPSTTPMPVTTPAPTGKSVPHAASGESSRNGDSMSSKRLDAFACQQLVALTMALDVLRAAAGVDDRQLLVMLTKLRSHCIAVGAERVAVGHHPIRKDRHCTHFGGRFSANAAIPSRPSSLVNNDSDSDCSSAIVCVPRSNVLVAATALGPPSRMLRVSSAVGASDIVGDVRDQSHVERLHRVEDLTGEVRSSQLRPAAALQDWPRDGRRSDPDPHLGEGERDRRVDDDQVAGRHQPDAAGAHRAVDCRDHRRRCCCQPFHRAHERRGVDAAGRPLLQIGPGTEHRRRVGEHDRRGRVAASAASSAA